MVKSVGKPDARNGHVRFDERGRETGGCQEAPHRALPRLYGRLLNDPHFAELPYDVIAQCCLLGLNGEQLGRLDLRFKHRHSQRDYFAFESKRLHVTYPGGSFSTEYPTYAVTRG